MSLFRHVNGICDGMGWLSALLNDCLRPITEHNEIFVGRQENSDWLVGCLMNEFHYLILLPMLSSLPIQKMTHFYKNQSNSKFKGRRDGVLLHTGYFMCTINVVHCRKSDQYFPFLQKANFMSLFQKVKIRHPQAGHKWKYALHRLRLCDTACSKLSHTVVRRIKRRSLSDFLIPQQLHYNRQLSDNTVGIRSMTFISYVFMTC